MREARQDAYTSDASTMGLRERARERESAIASEIREKGGVKFCVR